MKTVFNRLCRTAFGFDNFQIARLIEDSRAMQRNGGIRPTLSRRAESPFSDALAESVDEPTIDSETEPKLSELVPESRQAYLSQRKPDEGSQWLRDEADDDEDEPSAADASLAAFFHLPSNLPAHLQRRAPIPRPLSPTLSCRRPLHTKPILQRLNVPIYIATDARTPRTSAALAVFFDSFPCAFVLDDFSGTGEPAVNRGTVEELVDLRRNGDGQWRSEWDGSPLGRFLLPFLEAEIAARARFVIGSELLYSLRCPVLARGGSTDGKRSCCRSTAPGSTFSGYTAGLLHTSYVEHNMTTDRLDQRSIPIQL